MSINDKDTQLAFQEITFDGRIETTDLVDVDNALVKVLAKLLDTLYVHNANHKRNKRLHAFLSRPKPSDKVGMGEFDDPKDFVKALSSRIRSKKTAEGDRLKEQDGKVELPFVFVARDPSIRFDTDYNRSDVRKCADMRDDDGNFLAEVDMSTFMLSYNVYLVGWHHHEVSQLATHFAMWLRIPTSERLFTYKSALYAEPVELNAILVETNDVTFENASVPVEEGKLQSLTFSLTVSANVLQARYGTSVDQRIEAEREHINNEVPHE